MIKIVKEPWGSKSVFVNDQCIIEGSTEEDRDLLMKALAYLKIPVEIEVSYYSSMEKKFKSIITSNLS